MGVRFRGGWAVVDKGSKIYHNLTKLPMLKNPKEMPLSFLKQLPFITRAMDVKLIYGADVFAKYVTLSDKIEVEEAVAKVTKAEKTHLENKAICCHRLDNGMLCKINVADEKVSSYCSHHILQDPKLEEIGFEIPKVMLPKQRKKLRKTAFNEIRKSLNKRNKKNDKVVETTPTNEDVINKKEA